MKDLFSGHAAKYAQYRPTYPPELFAFIFSRVPKKETAWDCATGNGQTAIELAKIFEKVFATDISQTQLDHARQSSQIFYSLQAAEKTNFDDNSFDLVTVSQALHWLQFETFYTEVRRVTKKDGWIAVWTYSLLKIAPEIDTLVSKFHFDFLKEYWSPERKYVDDGYATIPFPFEEITTPALQIEYNWTIEELQGYITTWSAVQKFIKEKKYNPVPDLLEQINPHWTSRAMNVHFPLCLRMGKISK